MYPLLQSGTILGKVALQASLLCLRVATTVWLVPWTTPHPLRRLQWNQLSCGPGCWTRRVESWFGTGPGFAAPTGSTHRLVFLWLVSMSEMESLTCVLLCLSIHLGSCNENSVKSLKIDLCFFTLCPCTNHPQEKQKGKNKLQVSFVCDS